MEEQILAFLEQYGQPQGLEAICQDGLGQDQPDRASVQAVLDSMVEDGAVQRVEAGVHANGNAAVEYAPQSFQPDEPA